jgi:hypothetical protein
MLSDDGSLLPTPALQQWSDFTIEGTSKVGQSITAASAYKKPLGEASFINRGDADKWPTNPWPKDPKFKQQSVKNARNLIIRR